MPQAYSKQPQAYLKGLYGLLPWVLLPTWLREQLFVRLAGVDGVWLGCPLLIRGKAKELEGGHGPSVSIFLLSQTLQIVGAGLLYDTQSLPPLTSLKPFKEMLTSGRFCAKTPIN